MNGPSPRVSVCIPTVARPTMFREALASVLDQTFTDIEILVSENSGTPEYARTVDEIVAELTGNADGRLRVIHQPEQLPLVQHANVMFETARGGYLVHLPDDDRLRPEFLTVLASALDRHDDAIFAFCDHWMIDASGAIDRAVTERHARHYRRKGQPTGPISHEQLFSLALVAAFPFQCTLFRREIATRFPLREDSDTPDTDLQLRIAAAPDDLGAYFVADRLAEVRFHGDQYSGSGTALSLVRALEDSSPVPGPARKLYRRQLALAYAALGRQHLLDRQRSEGFRCLRRAIRIDPGARLAYRSLIVSMIPRSIQLRLRKRLRPRHAARSTSTGRG